LGEKEGKDLGGRSFSNYPKGRRPKRGRVGDKITIKRKKKSGGRKERNWSERSIARHLRSKLKSKSGDREFTPTEVEDIKRNCSVIQIRRGLGSTMNYIPYKGREDWGGEKRKERGGGFRSETDLEVCHHFKILG